MNFIIRIIVTGAVAFGLAQVLSGIHVDSFWTAIVFALVLAVINAIIRPALILLTIPITILTLGFFLLVINALTVLLASKFVKGFAIDGFWWGFLFALLLSILSSLLFSSKDKDKS
ncbi:MAG: hypothetical protein C5B52_00895 [Bacteroidetes bacterium]|nr:MAG: hypothetical protein C5B52_00895 [Bacteroidota bacterium]